MAPLSDAKRLVIKIGSALLVDAETGRLRTDWLQGLAKDIARARENGADVVIVSSGSIALGRRVLKFPAGALPLEQSQAAAAVGQIRLARAYEEVLAPLGITTAQVLLTLEDSEDRRRYLNSRATLTSLLNCDVVPIVNENDTVATDEIRYGDNDRLAAQVASMCGADVLVLLSDVDGLYTGNPRENADAKHLPLIEAITQEIEAMAGGEGSELSKGGMKTKLIAARTAMHAGCAMYIMQGDVDRPLQALSKGAKSTLFKAKDDPQAARKRWINGMRPAGAIKVDAGAANALRNGKSMLPAGATGVRGTFQRGDIVMIEDEAGTPLAKGISTYDAAEVDLIKGQKSDRIKDILGYPGRTALVHRDDMVMQ